MPSLKHLHQIVVLLCHTDAIRALSLKTSTPQIVVLLCHTDGYTERCLQDITPQICTTVPYGRYTERCSLKTSTPQIVVYWCHTDGYTERCLSRHLHHKYCTTVPYGRYTEPVSQDIYTTNSGTTGAIRRLYRALSSRHLHHKIVVLWCHTDGYTERCLSRHLHHKYGTTGAIRTLYRALSHKTSTSPTLLIPCNIFIRRRISDSSSENIETILPEIID